MKLNVRLFAAAKQAANRESIDLELSAEATLANVREALIEQLPHLLPLRDHLRFSVNAEYASDSTRVCAQDEVACIPPVSGG